MKKIEEIIKKHLRTLTENNDEMFAGYGMNKSQHETDNYMFFSNLKQIHRQCEMLLKMDHQMVDDILTNGHDWADDHVTEAKTNMDQVFDFIMNTTKESLNEVNDIFEGKNKPTNPKLWKQSLAWARSKYKVCPSAYCNGAAAKRYKQKGGRWTKKK